MIAVDPFEQKHTKTFELIGSNTQRHSVPGCVKVGSDFGFTQGSHGQARDRYMLEQDLAVASNRCSRVQLMRPTGKRVQLCGRLAATLWLVEQMTAQRQRLISTDNNA